MDSSLSVLYSGYPLTYAVILAEIFQLALPQYFIFIYYFIAQVLKVYRTPSSTACSKTMMLLYNELLV